MDSPIGLTNSQNLLMTKSSFDELAYALSSCARAPSPDSSLTSSCKGDDCECCQYWMDVKGKLEEKLDLAAKVGQALLEKHEAFVRNHPIRKNDLQATLMQLEEENQVLDQRLKAAEEEAIVLEATHASTVETLQNANTEITRLTTLTARSAGWERKLQNLESLNEDLKQELEYARKSETRVTSLEANCERLLEENAKLKQEVSRIESSVRTEREESARDARVRLENLLAAIPRANPEIYTQNQEVMKILERLVADNEALKRANAEHANLLAETREELRAAQSNAEVTPDIEILSSPPLARVLGHRSTTSITSFASIQRRNLYRREADSSNVSTRRSSPDTRTSGAPPESRSAIPAMLRIPSDDSDSVFDSPILGKPKSPMRTLMLLTRESAVQTDSISSPSTYGSPRQGGHHLAPNLFTELSSSRPSTSTAHSVHSSNSDRENTTSFSPTSNPQSIGQSHSPMTTLTASLASLFTKLQQADISTIYTRLRRQHLSITKESLRHISDTTLKGLDSSVRELVMPSHGPSIDGERPARWEGAWVGRDEWRVLLGWCRGVLLETLMLRQLANETALKGIGKEKDVGSWIKPISRLFSGSGPETGAGGGGIPIVHPSTHLNQSPKAIKPAPKLQPALAPSTTTVNVEFTGAGVRHTTPNPETQMARELRQPSMTSDNLSSTPKAVRDIFAGSRMPSSNDTKDWVVLPRKSSKMFARPSTSSGPSTSKQSVSGTVKKGRRMSRALEAILDDSSSRAFNRDEESPNDDPNAADESDQGRGPFNTVRTLRSRGRGLSDNSIHTTFMNQGAHLDTPNSTVRNRPSMGALPTSMFPDRSSMFNALSQRVQSLASSVSGGSSLLQSPPPLRERGRGISSSPRFGHDSSRNPSRTRDGL